MCCQKGIRTPLLKKVLLDDTWHHNDSLRKIWSRPRLWIKEYHHGWEKGRFFWAFRKLWAWLLDSQARVRFGWDIFRNSHEFCQKICDQNPLSIELQTHPDAQNKSQIYLSFLGWWVASYSNWWLNQSLSKNMHARQIGISFPQGSGVNIPKNVWVATKQDISKGYIWNIAVRS